MSGQTNGPVGIIGGGLGGLAATCTLAGRDNDGYRFFAQIASLL